MEHLSHSPSCPRWYVLQTKPQQEARVLAALQRLHFSCLLPMLSDAGAGASGVSPEPLFPRYLFVQIDNPAAASVLRSTEGVTRLLKLNNELAPVQDSLILALQERGLRGGDAGAGAWSHASGAYPVLDAMQKVSGAARGLKMIELVCQPESLRFVANPLRMAA